jgi:hypothetical protein
MVLTRHIQAQMSRRGIRKDLLEFAQQFGEPDQDKTVLRRKALSNLIEELRQLERLALRALDKGGLVVVESGDTLITTYRLDSYDRSKARHGRQVTV